MNEQKKNQYQQAVEQLLKDFIPFQPELGDYQKAVNIFTGLHNPPSYIIQILLLWVVDFKNYGSADKVLWHTYFKFKDYPFLVEDYKFGSWTIACLKNDARTFQIAKEVKNKIIKASELIDKILSNELKTQIIQNNFYLNNVYNKLFSIYCFFEDKMHRINKTFEKKEISQDKKSWARRMQTNWEFENQLTNYCFAATQAFFSLLEFILNGFYAFNQKEVEFNEFIRERDWKNKFKQVFPINDSQIIKTFYDKLVYIKDSYRNPVTHGLTEEPISLLIPIPQIGLVPLSYEFLSNKIHYGLFNILEKNETIRVVSIFRDFLKFLQSNEPYYFYILYFESGFPIPISSEKINKIKKEMTSHENFLNYLRARASYEDAILNRDL